MRLTFEQFKKKVAETKAKVAQAFAPAAAKARGKLSATQQKRWRRAKKMAPRAACDSFRWVHKHRMSNESRLRRERRVRSARRIYNATRKKTSNAA